MEWTDSESLRLVELFNDGLTDDQIGMKIGRTATAVCNRRKKMKLLRVEMPRTRPHCSRPANPFLDCMDWPFPFKKPKTREIFL